MTQLFNDPRDDSPVAAGELTTLAGHLPRQHEAPPLFEMVKSMRTLRRSLCDGDGHRDRCEDRLNRLKRLNASEPTTPPFKRLRCKTNMGDDLRNDRRRDIS